MWHGNEVAKGHGDQKGRRRSTFLCQRRRGGKGLTVGRSCRRLDSAREHRSHGAVHCEHEEGVGIGRKTARDDQVRPQGVRDAVPRLCRGGGRPWKLGRRGGGAGTKKERAGGRGPRPTVNAYVDRQKRPTHTRRPGKGIGAGQQVRAPPCLRAGARPRVQVPQQLLGPAGRDLRRRPGRRVQTRPGRRPHTRGHAPDAAPVHGHTAARRLERGV